MSDAHLFPTGKRADGERGISVTTSSSFPPAAQKDSHTAAATLSPDRPVNPFPTLSHIRSHSLAEATEDHIIEWPSTKYPAVPNRTVDTYAKTVIPVSHVATVASNSTTNTASVAQSSRCRLVPKATSFDYSMHLSKAMTSDPFDTDWASIPISQTKNMSGNSQVTNPFKETRPGIIQTFEVQM